MNGGKRGKIIEKVIIVVFITILALLFSNIFRFTGYLLLTTTNESATVGNLSFNTIKNHTMYISIEKTGTNVTSAKINMSGQKGLFTGWYFDLNETNTKPAGITMNGTFFWVPDSGNKQVYVYNMSGQYVKNWSVPNTPIDITHNTTNIWISSGGNITYYDMDGTYLDDWIPTNCTLNSLLQQGNRGISSNDTNIFVVTDITSTNTRICTYTHNGSHVRTETGVTAFQPPQINGLYTNTTYFWIPVSTKEVYQQEQNITVNKEKFSTIFGTTQIRGRGITGNISNLFLVAYNMSDDATNPTTPGRVYKMHMESLYANNTWLEVGTEDGTYEWSHSGQFNIVNNQTADFASVINSYLSTCTAVSGNCTVPFKFHSDTSGIIDYFGIRISYNDTQNPVVTLTPSTNQTDVGIGMQTALSCTSTDNVGIPTVKIIVAGSQVCSGSGSCSYTYTMSTSGDKTVTCEATDREANNGTKTIILTGTVPQPIAPAPSPAPSPAPQPIIMPEEEVKETLPLELTPEIKPTIISDITAEISEEKVIISLEDKAQLKLYFEDGPRPKPRLDMKFSTTDVPKLKQTIPIIKYIDWHYYLNVSLLFVLLALIINLLYRRYYFIL